MMKVFPKFIANKAIILYLTLIIVIPLTFGYPMEWFAYIWGIVFVVSFFYYSNTLSKKWLRYNVETFSKKLFVSALIIRIFYVFVSYWFYCEMSETPPFELGSPGDSWNYDLKAAACADIIRNDLGWKYVVSYLGTDIADVGYVCYLTVVYYLTGNSIIMTRIINSVFSAMVVVFIYKIAKRHYGEETGRLAGVITLLMPNFIFYCGLHLKETIMVFLIVYFINSADVILIENKKWQNLLPMFLCGMVLFTFRTVLGAVAFLSFFTTLLFTKGKMMSWGKRIIVGLMMVGLLGVFVGDDLKKEIQYAWEKNDGNTQQQNMEWRAKRKNGNKFAKYAGAAVFAPLIFTIPFPTMVATPAQENQRLIHGGNYVKNVLSFFTILAVFVLIFSGEWRKHVLILSFILGYLVVLVFSTFAQSERFHQPVLPFEMLLATFGISQMTKRKYKIYFNCWIIFLFVADMGWQWFKLRGRGM